MLFVEHSGNAASCRRCKGCAAGRICSSGRPGGELQRGGGFGGKPAGGLYPLRRGRTQRAHAVGVAGRRAEAGGGSAAHPGAVRPGLSLRALRGGGHAAQPVCAGVSGEPARAHCVSGDQPGLPVCLRVLPFWAVRQAPLVPAGAGKTEHPDAGALRRAHREIHRSDIQCKPRPRKCHFGVLSLGAVAAPSTSIENGFEYHFDEFKKALEEYVKCRNKELELMRQTEDEADRASNAFDQAIKALSGERPRIAPPGRNGVVAFAVSGAISSPDELNSSFNTAVRLGDRGAISAAVLAPDEATAQNNVLSRFFSTLKERSGGVAGVLDGVMDVWGRLLVGYGDIQGSADELMDEMIKGLGGGSGALGSIASWLGDTVSASVAALGLEPCDLRLRKPVLTDSANVIKSPGSDIAGLSQAQDKLRSIPLGVTDPKALCEALEYQVERTISGTVFTLAEIPLPGGGSIPLTVDVATLVGALGGGS